MENEGSMKISFFKPRIYLKKGPDSKTENTANHIKIGVQKMNNGAKYQNRAYSKPNFKKSAKYAS